MTANLMNATAPDLDMIEQIALATIAQLPAAHRVLAASIGVTVMDFVPEDLMAEIGLDDPFALTGLYTGIPMPEKSTMDQATTPDTIWLFRRPILDEWCLRGDVTLLQMVAHVTVHELAHHFGWSDDDIAKIDKWWEY
ncbi:metallopeptidase family protein [Pacificibacter marinus]|uniref:Possibl zinc metallo-peptidase n=1 Tax=Pacificibacter marinus TaxID=658057 RepID=A0A1Y5SGC3_9RHOB|nr:metallopeptidase family protein [Pacificibacter marinus]SEK52372.1 Predicted Zn-dependent protease, minimal metalloprotease (MMP)-like domain [Pacificibacter marinus]SLN38444.1 Possibl zinc metallo-peptidase [Pacificibacter marinus]